VKVEIIVRGYVVTIIHSKSFTDSKPRAFYFHILTFDAYCFVCRTKY